MTDYNIGGNIKCEGLKIVKILQWAISSEATSGGYMFTELKEYPKYKIHTEGFIVNPNNKILTVWKDVAGYCFVTMKNSDGEYKKLRLHRVVATAFIQNPEGLPEVNHIDGNKSNNWSENLEWTTSKGNKEHAWSTGLYNNKIEDHYAAVLNNTQVNQICKMLELGVSNDIIADKFNVCKSIISHIKNGDTWKDISKGYNIKTRKKPRKSLSDIHKVCKLISEGKDLNFILELLPNFNKKDLYRIKTKQTYKNISDNYF